MSAQARGIAALLAAYVIWGLSPLFYVLIADVPPLEILAHRTLWSLVFFVVILLGQGRIGQAWQQLGTPGSVLLTAFAAVMISANWFVYIYAIQLGRTVEASLGYYMFPLVVVVLGMLFFGEKLGILQWVSVALAAAAVLVLTRGVGAVPWFSLSLAFTFGLYSALKKRSRAGPVVSVAAEVAVLTPLAMVWLWGVHRAGWLGIGGEQGAVFGRDWRGSLLLVLSGPMTAGPLVLFSYATKRVSLATTGLLQYINPTLQFLCAVVIFSEPFTASHMVAFGLIWAAVSLYSAHLVLFQNSGRDIAIGARRPGAG